ncbi:hypothetical protein [Paraburkholderia tropica]|uniref:hypothetical protein n=4 Tax=Paraburkholderia tropica TaxID=92647 RepID=UPI0017E2BEE0|nr:hypothetical protein [Paraburkholderia tropica]MBB6317325.1 hypothetical protein [Paraburkholderia tropica]
MTMSERCHVCRKNLTWFRRRLTRCDCGADLKASPVGPAAGDECTITRWMQNLLDGRELGEPFAGLTLEDFSTLCIVLGSYSANRGMKKPLRSAAITNVGEAVVIARHAAMALDDWPNGLYRLLETAPGAGSDSTEISKQFGVLYGALFKLLAREPFDFVREAFRSYLAQTWRRPITARHRRLVDEMQDHDWVSGRVLKEFGVAPALVRRIAQANPLVSDEAHHRKRNHLAFSKSAIFAKAHRYSGGLTLALAAVRLGLPRKRVRQMAEDGFLDVLPRASMNQPWIISVQSVVGWETISDRVTHPPIANAQTARSLLRKLLWSRRAWSLFLSHVRARRLVMWRLDGGTARFGDFMIDPDALNKLLAPENDDHAEWFGVPDAARKLGVKDEVCYHLVRKRLLASEVGTLRDRECRVVHRSAIESFQSTYIPLVSAAKECCTTPRALLATIRAKGIEPMCGPDVDGCRQYFLLLSDWRRGALLTGAAGHNVVPPTRRST